MGVKHKHMKDLNTKSIINLLPFPGNFKLDLLEKYDGLPREEQLKISDIVWEAYYAVYDFKIRENFDKAIETADKKGEKPDEKFYAKIVEKTDKEIEDLLTSSSENVDLSAARKSMEMIIKEINASKKSNPALVKN